MKTRASVGAALLLAGVMICFSYAGTAKLPDIPKSKISAAAAITAADRQLQQLGGGRQPTWLLIGADWSHADHLGQFHPRVSDGTQFHVTEAVGEWSWFLTYVEQQSGTNKALSVHVLRVRDTGAVSLMTGTRT